MKEHLRNGVVLHELVLLSAEERDQYATKAHVPNFIALQIAQCVQQVFRTGGITTADHLNIRMHTMALLNISGACERIKKTPIPFSYNVYLKLFITIYALCLPFALIPVFGYWSVLLVGLVFFAFIGVELMAEEIEDPFGLDCNDLPTGDIANIIRKNVFELLELKNTEPEAKRALYSKVF